MKIKEQMQSMRLHCCDIPQRLLGRFQRRPLVHAQRRRWHAHIDSAEKRSAALVHVRWRERALHRTAAVRHQLQSDHVVHQRREARYTTHVMIIKSFICFLFFFVSLFILILF